MQSRAHNPARQKTIKRLRRIKYHAFGGDVFLYTIAQPKKRPDGITVIAILWTIASAFNIYQGLNGIITDLGLLPYFSFNPHVPEWFSFGIPAEIMLNFFVVAFGFLTLLVVYGLLTSRSWSYHLALAVPIFITIINMAAAALYLSAPPELELAEIAGTAIVIIVVNLAWGIIIWSYLTRPHVKQYLNQVPTPAVVSVPVPPSPAPTAFSEEKKFCRYCGGENKADAVFCEKCGRKVA